MLFVSAGSKQPNAALQPLRGKGSEAGMSNTFLGEGRSRSVVGQVLGP